MTCAPECSTPQRIITNGTKYNINKETQIDIHPELRERERSCGTIYFFNCIFLAW